MGLRLLTIPSPSSLLHPNHSPSSAGGKQGDFQKGRARLDFASLALRNVLFLENTHNQQH